jgi:hypothetical protein
MLMKIGIGRRLGIGSAASFSAWINFALRSPPETLTVSEANCAPFLSASTGL